MEDMDLVEVKRFEMTRGGWIDSTYDTLRQNATNTLNTYVQTFLIQTNPVKINMCTANLPRTYRIKCNPAPVKPFDASSIPAYQH